jgi:hypothetical protein
MSRATILIGLALGATAVLGGCGNGAAAPGSTPSSQTVASPGLTVAVEQTRGAIANVLTARGVAAQFGGATRPYRPAESPRLRDAPRAVYQVVLSDQPDAGFVVVYEFPDPASAVDAGNEEAGFLGTGPARVSFPRDAQHILRQLGPTLIIFSWSPSDADATLEASVAAALGTLGIGFTVPN